MTTESTPGHAGRARRVWHALGLLLLMPLIAGFSVASVQIYLGTGIRFLPMAMVASIALAAYALNRLTDGEEDRLNMPGEAGRYKLSGAANLILATLVMSG